MLNCAPSSHSIFFRLTLTPTFLTATANSRVTRGMITLAVYVALQLGSVALGIAITHKPAATSESVMAVADAPKLPIDFTEAF